MINFTVGPVQSNEEVKRIGSENIPYFRTPEFSKIMLENERLILKFAKAKQGSRAVFMTCSGTGSMETAIINCLNKNDKALVVNGGSFGNRFVELLKIHEIPFTEIHLPYGKALKKMHLQDFENKGYTAFLINVHETSTGVHYNMDLISDFCKRNNLFLIVDAISSFLADPFDMGKSHTDILITGSQKALACPPGVSIIVLSPEAQKRVESNDPRCMYLNLKTALSNQERGQTPFTPAVGVLLQIHSRLLEIEKNGGVESEIERIESLAEYFRERIKKLPFEIVSESYSNAVTSLSPKDKTKSAYKLFELLKDNYGIWICPNGGEMKNSVFRVGHIGNLKKSDYDYLISSIENIIEKNIW